MRVCVRADGGPPVGWGHLARCRALAQVLTALGAKVEWACRNDDALARFLGSEPALPLDGPISFDPLGEGEAQAVADWARGADWLVVDHYGADEAWLAQITDTPILLVEDHQVRSGATLRLAPMQGPADASLTGVEHLLMHPCFAEVAEASRPTDHPERSGIVVCFGGAAPAHFLSEALHALPADAPLTVLAPERALNDAAHARLAQPGALHRPWIEPEGMAALLASAEAALVSSTVMAFEALAVGCPIVAVEWIDNQARHATTLRGMGLRVETSTAAGAEALAAGFASRGDVPVDGRGCYRVAEAMGLT